MKTSSIRNLFPVRGPPTVSTSSFHEVRLTWTYYVHLHTSHFTCPPVHTRSVSRTPDGLSSTSLTSSRNFPEFISVSLEKETRRGNATPRLPIASGPFHFGARVVVSLKLRPDTV